MCEINYPKLVRRFKMFFIYILMERTPFKHSVFSVRRGRFPEGLTNVLNVSIVSGMNPCIVLEFILVGHHSLKLIL